MLRDLPTPDQILEELSDKTAAQIDRLTPIAFDNAFSEMSRYHRFLLALNAAQAPDGSPFNYAEVPGDAWNAPHRNWIRQYARLFERAADHIPDERHFIHSLAYAPVRLLPSPGEPHLPPGIMKAILDLGPIMIHRLEDWVTKRTTIETQKGSAAQPRVALAGSDAKAYLDVVPELVGAWETLLQRAPELYGWSEEIADGRESERWSAFRASWPFLWQHLSNTAYSLAVAVWNEDKIGAELFSESLVRWPETLSYRHDDHAELRWRRLLFPDILNMSWPEASARAKPLSLDYMPPPTPDQLFASVVRGVHDDVMLLSAALLLFWTINDKQASDIGGRTARSLLHREKMGTDDRRSTPRELSLRSLLLDVVRIAIAGERFNDNSYGAQLDGLVQTLDNMTERRVVPGRVFTPSTIHGRDNLLFAVIAILAAAAPIDGDDGLEQRIADLAENENVLPEGDRSLRNVLNELGRFRIALEQPSGQLHRGAALLAPDHETERAFLNLRRVTEATESAIRSKRLARLKARPVDPGKLEAVRSKAQTAILKEPSQVPYFRNVRIQQSPADSSVEFYTVTINGIDKAQLVEPPMDSTISNFAESLASQVRGAAEGRVLSMFGARPRTKVVITAKVEEEAFWQQIDAFLSRVGPDPMLLVSQSAEGRVLRRLLYEPPERRPNLRIEKRPRDQRGSGSYITTIYGVDIFGDEDIPSGIAWLSSARALDCVRYFELDKPGEYVDIAFEPSILLQPTKGKLRLRFRQQVDWVDGSIFEIHGPDPEEEA